MPRESPLARIGFEKHELENRTNALTKDALTKNAYYEDETRRMVKRPGITLDTTFSGTCGSGLYTFEDDLIAVVDDVVKTIGGGSSFSAYELRSNTLPVFFRAGALSFDGALYIVGGLPSDGSTKVYKSTDGGATWAVITSSPAYGNRWDHGFCVHDGKMWVSGGIDGVLNWTNGVYSSSDGVTWATVRANSASDGFTKVRNHNMISFDNKLWNIGGSIGLEPSGEGYTDEVWYSNSGVSWTLATSAPGWTPRRLPGVGVHNNKLWVIGGYDGAAYKNDVWSSPDGISWTLATASAGFTGRENSVVFSKNGYLYCGFGYDGTGGTETEQDLWKSADGITWSLVQADQTTIDKTPSGFLHSDGGLYVFQALSDFIPSPNNKVWRSTLDLGSESLGTITTAAPGTVNNPGSICEQVDFAEVQLSPDNIMFLKTTRDAWQLTNGTLTAITDVDYPALTVPGVVSLDGYIFVMTPKAEIYNSDLETPTAWNALNFITAEMEPDSGIAIAKHLNYVVAFGDWSTEFFYDAANATGSPLSRLDSSSLWIGCAAARSVVNIGNNLLWVAKDRTKGRFVMALEGLTAMRVSTAPVDRILTASTLTTVRSYPIMMDGHLFYVLNLLDDDMTLVLDIGTKKWAVWTTLTAAASKSVTLARTGETATGTSAAHGYSEGDIVTIAGATQTDYNGEFVIHNVATNTFDFTVRNSPVTPATGTITVKKYTEAEFIGTYAAQNGGTSYVQDPLTGNVYNFSSTAYRDGSAPIKTNLRTREHDFDTLLNKFVAYLELHADREDSFVSYRYSDDDYRTYSKFRDKWLNGRVKFDRTGSTRRRAHEIVHVGNTAFRVQYLEAYLEQGEH